MAKSPKELAQELRNKGYTYEQAREELTSATMVGRKAFIDSKTEANVEAGDATTVQDAPISDRENPIVTETLMEFEALESANAKPITPPSKPAQVVTSTPIPAFERRDFSLDLNTAFGIKDKIDTFMNEKGSSEFALITSNLLGQDSQQLKQEYASGNLTGESLAVQELTSKNKAQIVQDIQEKVNKSQSPQETREILTWGKSVLEKPISILDLRTNYVIEELQPPTERVSRFKTQIIEDAKRVRLLQKLDDKVWEETGILETLADFGEIIIPTGIVTEEYQKWDNSIGDILERVSKAPKEKQEEVFLQAVDTFVETETLLFQNSNSILLSDQLQGLASAIREGGLGYLNGDLTEAQMQDMLESAFNATFLAGEGLAIGKGMKGLYRWLAGRIFPEPEEFRPEPNRIIRFGEVYQTDEKNILRVERDNTARIVPASFADKRDQLQAVAEAKQPTKVRITLEEEKKQLGAFKFNLENVDINKEARALANEQNITFKQAKKRVKENRNKVINDIVARQDTLQEMINDFDKAATAESQLSRIETFLKDGRLTEKDLKYPTSYKVDTAYDTRRSNSGYEYIAKNKIAKFLEDAYTMGITRVADDVGMSQEDMAMQFAPSPAPVTDRGMGNITAIDEPESVNSLLLMQVDAHTAGIKRGIELQRRSGGTLKLQESATSVVANDVPDSAGDFKLLYGDGEQGFENALDAEQAMKRGLLGVDDKRVVERDGQFFVEATIRHEFNPKFDTTNLGIDFANIENKNEYIFDPLRRLGEDQLKGVFALKGYNRAVAKNMQEELESIFTNKGLTGKAGIRPLNAETTKDLVKSLEWTDRDGNDWISNIDDFASLLGKSNRDVQDSFQRYQRIQRLMEKVFYMRNDKYRKYLKANDFNYLEVGDDFKAYGRVIKDLDDDAIKGRDFFDVETKRVIPFKEGNQDKIVVKLERPVADSEGNLRSVVLVTPDNVKDIPRIALNQRKGHIDRFYRETGWTVKVKNTRVVDGKEEEYFTTSHIVKNKEEADELANDLREDPSDRDSIRVLRARENDELNGIFGDSESAQFGYKASHMRERGDLLKGSDGMDAPTSGVLESLSRTIAGVERQLDVDMIQALKKRFVRTFEPYLKQKGGTSYSSNLDEMFNRSEIDKDVAEKAKQWHNYIESLSGMKQGEVFSAIDRFADGILETIGVNRLVTSDSQRVSSLAQNFTTQMIIVGRPLFQIPQNLMQSVYVGLKYGIDGGKAVAKAPFVMNALLKRTPDNVRMLAKMYKKDESFINNMLDDLESNGLWNAVGMSDDFLRMVHQNSIDASPTKAKNAWSIAKNIAVSPLNASKGLQEGTLRLVNVMAYLSEIEKTVIKGGRPFNAKTKQDIIYNVQTVTQTQNSVNQFSYQDKASVFSVMFQFTQHVHKLFLDIVVDPALKITKDPVMRMFGKEASKRVSPFASSHMQAVGTLAGVYTVFGSSGIFGNMGGQLVEDHLAQIENPYLREALQANLLNTMINKGVEFAGGEGSVDVSAKMNPASLIDSVYEFHIKGLLDGTLNIGGAVHYMGGLVAQTVGAVYEIAKEPALATDEKADFIFKEVMSNIQGFSDWERAYISYHMGNYVYKSNLSGNLSTTKFESIMQASNLAPALVADRFHEFSSDSKQVDNTVQKLAKLWSRQMQREMAELQSKGGSYQGMLEIMRKYSEIMQTNVDPLKRREAVKELSRYFPSAGGVMDYIKPYIEKKDLNDVIFELKGMREDAGTDEQREMINSAISQLEPMIETINRNYGEE